MKLKYFCVILLCGLLSGCIQPELNVYRQFYVSNETEDSISVFFTSIRIFIDKEQGNQPVHVQLDIPANETRQLELPDSLAHDITLPSTFFVEFGVMNTAGDTLLHITEMSDSLWNKVEEEPWLENWTFVYRGQ